MRGQNYVLLFFCLLAFVPCAALHAGSPQEYTVVLSPGDTIDGQPRNLLSISSQFNHFRHNTITESRLGDSVAGPGFSNSTGVAVGYTRKLSEMFSLGVSYQFVYTFHKGEALVDERRASYTIGLTERRIRTHNIEVSGAMDLREYGRLSLAFTQGYDSFVGWEVWRHRSAPNSIPFDDRSTSPEHQTRSAIEAWYEVDFHPYDGLTLSPYAGWKTVYTDHDNLNFKVGSVSQFGVHYDELQWDHFATLGVQLKHESGPWEATLRGGVNHRVGNGRRVIFASRTIAPGVTHFGYGVNYDRTVGTFGAGVARAFRKGTVSLDYDGFTGSHTISHKVSLNAAFTF